MANWITRSPKVVTLLIGTNNADDANYPVVNTAEGAELAAIVKVLRENSPRTKICCCGVPATSTKPDGTGSSAGNAATNLRAGELIASMADNKHVYLGINSVFLRPGSAVAR